MDKFIALCSIAIIFCSCKQGRVKQKKSYPDTLLKSSSAIKETSYKEMGERLALAGDFNGDGKPDTVFESYISSITGKETYKVMDSTDWEENVDMVIKDKPVCRIYSTINNTDTFAITRESQQTGISFFENLGDLNNKKGDEIGYVIEWADNSNLNRYHILTFSENKQWEEVFSFPINESVNYEPENLFKPDKIIKKIGKNRIQYKFYSDSATVETGETIIH